MCPSGYRSAIAQMADGCVPWEDLLFVSCSDTFRIFELNYSDFLMLIMNDEK